MAFGAGVLLGIADGGGVGGLMMLLYTLLNPYGPAPPLVMVSQVVGMALAGMAGGGFARAGGAQWRPAARGLALGALAAGITATFDLITNAATGLVFGQVRFWILAGIPFSLWHIAWNVALFVVIGTPIVGVLAHYRARLSPSLSS